MNDIFLSYAREDTRKAKALADALSRCGWTVWWDKRIPAGRDYAEVIKAALDSTRCVIVLWSKDSTSPKSWVRKEAGYAENRGVLVPVLIEEVEIPFEFQRIQAANLVGWEGDDSHEGFSTLVGDLTAMLGPPAADAHGTAPPAPPERPKRTEAGAEPAGLGEEPPPHARGESQRGDDAGRIREEDAGRHREEEAPPPPPSAEARRATNADAFVREVITEDDAGRPWHTPPRPMPYRLPLAILGVALTAGLMFVLFRSCGKSVDTTPNTNVVSRQTPTPRASPSVTPGNVNGASNPPDNRRLDPERVRKLGQLIQGLNAEDERKRRAATSELKASYASDPQAVEQSLGLLDESKVGELSPQALVNVIFFLNNASDEAWTAESYRKARTTLQRLEGMNLGSQAQGELGKFKVRLMLLPRIKRSKGDPTWGISAGENSP